MRDPDLCLEDMAYDVVWITPKQMYHFRTAKEIRDFLEQEMTAKPARYYVDIVSIKSSPSAADISTVAYEINLVSKEEEKAVYLRCSMAICKRGQHFEISFIHMSEKNGQAGMEQVREFTENLPCGVLIFAYMKNEGLKTLFYNEYFWKKLRYKEDVFQRQIEKDTFFMVSEEDREKIQAKLREIQGTSGHLAVSMTFFRKDGNRFQYRMIGAPAYQEGDNTVYYCVFQETTAFNMVHEQMRERIAAGSCGSGTASSRRQLRRQTVSSSTARRRASERSFPQMSARVARAHLPPVLNHQSWSSTGSGCRQAPSAFRTQGRSGAETTGSRTKRSAVIGTPSRPCLRAARRK